MKLPATLAALARSLQDHLNDADPHTAGADARYIMRHRAGADWADVIARPHQPVPQQALSLIESDLKAVLSGVPVSRLYGEREFYGLSFWLSPETLDPRPDTERLVDLALDRLKAVQNPRILDLGTGTGCILLSVLAQRPDATGLGIDRAFGALQTAARNAARHNLSGRAHFLCGHWAESVASTFDLVLSNPPYISNQALDGLSPAVLNHDPILALKGGEDGLQAYREIFIHLPSLVKQGGKALFEIGFDQQQSITRLSEESRFSDIAVHLDSAGLPRVAEIFF